MTPRGPLSIADALREIHHQNVVHDAHGYDGLRPGCPTCDLIGKIVAAAVVVLPDESSLYEPMEPPFGGSA